MSSSPNRDLPALAADAGPRKAATAAGAALDADAISRLQELDPDGRHGVVSRVMAAYETSLTRLLAQLRTQGEAGESCDVAQVARIAHTLKSSSASVGALALSAACADVEARLRDGAGDELSTDVDRLLAEGQAALAAVGAMLRSDTDPR